MAARISIDGGQSGTRIRLPDRDDIDVGPIRTDRPIVGQLNDYLHEVLSQATDGVEYELAVGVSGLTPAHAQPAELLAGCADLNVVRVALAHDSVSAYLGSNGWEFGAVVAVGTGIVGLGVSTQKITRVDGWGYMFGDAGSAYWIGRAGIDVALRAFDMRGAATILESKTVERFGPLPELYVSLQSDPDRVSKVAAFAVVVAQAADEGDALATQIISRAADELAHTASVAALRGHPEWTTPPRISWTGKVLTANDLLRGRFIEQVRATISDAEIVEPLGKPLDGVGRLFDAPAGHPLSQQVHRADVAN
ncbi:N-acetylglucosamine kinase [Gordonia effusa]|nr:BadF/BadG/BcrA/BcrD ATPase family protein [Gordonia effusa]